MLPLQQAKMRMQVWVFQLLENLLECQLTVRIDGGNKQVDSLDCEIIQQFLEYRQEVPMVKSIIMYKEVDREDPII